MPVVVLAVAVAVLFPSGVDSTERLIGRSSVRDERTLEGGMKSRLRYSYWCTILLAASESIQGEEELLHLRLGIWQPVHVEEIGLQQMKSQAVG